MNNILVKVIYPETDEVQTSFLTYSREISADYDLGGGALDERKDIFNKLDGMFQREKEVLRHRLISNQKGYDFHLLDIVSNKLIDIFDYSLSY